MRLYTPFYAKHVEYTAQLWKGYFGLPQAIPFVYTTIAEEYKMVRERAGFVDYSFGGNLTVVGRDAFAFLQKVMVNDLRKISPGKAIYSSFLDETGKVVDDLIVFWIEEDRFLLNATEEQLFEWLEEKARGLNVYVIRAPLAWLAFQGPKSREILQKAVDVSALPYMSFKQDKINGISAIISRCGFTGELGYEFFLQPEYGPELWDILIELGKEYDVGPYGLIGGEPFRLEKGYTVPVDFYEGSSLLEIGLGWTIGWDKGDFIGKEALMKRKSEGLKTKLMGFEVSDRMVVPLLEGDNVIKEGRTVGKVTSGPMYSPFVGRPIGFCWVEIGLAKEGEELEVEHGEERIKIKLARRCWYDPENKKVKG